MPASEQLLASLAAAEQAVNDRRADLERAEASLQTAEGNANDARGVVQEVEAERAACVQMQADIRWQISQLESNITQLSQREGFLANQESTRRSMLDGAISDVSRAQDGVAIARGEVDKAIAFAQQIAAEVAAANDS